MLREPKALKVKRDKRGKLEHRVIRDLKENKESKVLKEQQPLKVLKELLEHKV